jgi:uncharacterized protein involved in outer membrane biogenesis
VIVCRPGPEPCWGGRCGPQTIANLGAATLKKLLSALITLPVALVAAVLIVPSFVDWNQYRGELAAQGKALTGRDITIGGDISIALLPAPQVVARDVRMANLIGAAVPDMVRLGSLEVRIALGPLLGGNIQVETVRLIEPVIELEVLADGRRNWDLAAAASRDTAPAAAPTATTGAADPAAVPPALAVSLDNFVIKDGLFVYRDGRSATVETVKVETATIAAASLSGPFESAGRLELKGVAFDYEATVGAIINQRTAPLNLVSGVEAGTTRIQLDGTLVGLAETPKFKGKVKAAGKDLAGLVRMASGEGPLPGFLGQPFGIEGEMVAAATGAEVKSLVMNLGDTEAKGALTVKAENGVTTAARLTVRHVNLDKWLDMPDALPAKAASAPPPAEAKRKDGTPKASIKLVPRKAAGPPAPPTQAFALPAGLAGSLVAAVDTVTFRGGLVRQVKANIELAEGDVTISQLSAQLPGGSEFALFGVVGADKGKPRFEGSVEGKVNDLRRLLGWLGVKAPPVPSDRLRTLKMSGEISATAQEVQASAIKLKIDNTGITGGVTVALRRRLAFGADLALDSLNLDSYLTGQAKADRKPQEAAPAKESAAGAEKQATPANPFAALTLLNTIDANLTARVGSVIFRRTTIKNVVLDATLFNGTLKLRRASVADLAGVSVKASGTVAGLAGVPELKGVRFQLGGANLGRLFRLADVKPPVAPNKLGAVKINADLEGSLLQPRVKMRVKAAGVDASVSGSVSALTLFGGLKLKLTASHPNLVRLLGKLDVDYRPAGPIGAVKFAALVAGDPSKVTLSGIDAKIGAVTVKGSAALGLTGPRPKVSADLTTSKIIVDRFLPAKRAAWLPGRPPVWRARSAVVPAAWPGPVPFAQRSGVRPVAAKSGAAGRWPRDPIDLAALRAFDADLKVKAASLVFDTYALNKAQVTATVKDGVLRAERLTGVLFGGDLNATATVTSAPVLGVDAAMTLKNADVRRALGAVAGKSAAGGWINMDLAVVSRGPSVADLVAALGGKGNLALRGLDVKGGARGTALASILQLLTAVQGLGGGLAGKGGGLADVTGSFLIERGVARTQDLKLVSDLSNGAARGSVDLANWTLDVEGQLTMAQNLLTRLLASKVRIPQQVPFKVKGALDAPKVTLLRGSTGGAPQGGTGIKPLDKLLEKKGLGGVLDKIIPRQKSTAAPPAPAPSTDGTLAPPPPPPPTEQKKIRPEDILKQIFKVR